ncbi:hypothetical protein BD560DRAFT_493361 [Blakeslea trispora]|nr:hypothetical protein BD560DRAFT_493361 [Blakeslea trispora]
MDPTTTTDYEQSPPTFYATASYQDAMFSAETDFDSIELSYPSASTTAKINKRRSQVKNACVNCQKACKKCDEGRPCQRCIKLGITDTCINSPRKERKKGFKRGPYKKKIPQLSQQATPRKVPKTQKSPGLSPAAKPKARTASNASSLSYSPPLVDWPLDYSPILHNPSVVQGAAMSSEYHPSSLTPPYRNTFNLAEQSFYDFYNNGSHGNNNHSPYSDNYYKQQETTIKECYDPCVPVIDYNSLTIQQDFLLSIDQQSNPSCYAEDFTVYHKPLTTSQLLPKLEPYNCGGITSSEYDAVVNRIEFTDNYSNSKYCQHENNFLYNQWPKEQFPLDQQNIYATYDSQFF